MPTIDDARHWYPTDDPVHGFDHILRVYRLAERLAMEENADLEIVRAAALLHDAHGEEPGKAWDGPKKREEGESLEGKGVHDGQDKGAEITARQDHHLNSAAFARAWLEAEGWTVERISAVEHCIRAHRFRKPSEQPQTLEAQVLFDADKLDAIGAVGVARAVAFAAARRQPFYAEPSENFLRTGQTDPGEAHSAYHEYMFKLRRIRERLYTATGQAYAEERHRFMVEYFIRLQSEIDGLS